MSAGHPGPVHIDEAAVARLVTMEDALATTEACFRDARNPGNANLPRQRLPLLPGALNVMAAASGDHFGLKAYFATPAGGAYHVHLYSRSQGRYLAMIEANLLSQLRTGAASGVATKHLARADAATLGQIGTGKQAMSQLLAVCAVRPIAHVRVYGRDAARAQDFAQRAAALVPARVEVAASARGCVEGANVVTTITKATDPVLFGDWVAAGAHVNLAGANSLDRREADDALILRAGRLVTDDRAQAAGEAAEYARLVQARQMQWDQVEELGDIVGGGRPGRAAQVEVTVYKSLGIAAEDIALATRVYHRAVDAGMVRPLPG